MSSSRWPARGEAGRPSRVTVWGTKAACTARAPTRSSSVKRQSLFKAVKQAVLRDGDAPLVRDGVGAGELGEAKGALL
jgi:hypothetical protein